MDLESVPLKQKLIDDPIEESIVVCEQEEKSDLAVSISLIEDGTLIDYLETRQCEPLCPFARGRVASGQMQGVRSLEVSLLA